MIFPPFFFQIFPTCFVFPVFLCSAIEVLVKATTERKEGLSLCVNEILVKKPRLSEEAESRQPLLRSRLGSNLGTIIKIFFPPTKEKLSPATYNSPPVSGTFSTTYKWCMRYVWGERAIVSPTAQTNFLHSPLGFLILIEV